MLLQSTQAESRGEEDFAWTKVTCWILCCPEFVQDRKRVNNKDKDDELTVLRRARRVGNSEIFRYAWNRVGIHRIADRAAKEDIRM